MNGHECYHCKQWVEEGEAHDCWTTTEQALTGELSEELRDAWERLRETAASFGDQRIYASHNSIMFSRKSCYLFVRPKRTHLEVCVFLGRAVRAPQIRRVDRASKSKLAHVIRVSHRDEVEPLVQLAAPFAPHLAEELWERLGHAQSIFASRWPAYIEALAREDTIELAVQVNGKLRGTVSVPREVDQEVALQSALAQPQIEKFVTGAPRKVVFVPGRLLNIVV